MRKTKKSMVAVLSVALVAAIGAGATVAWLTDKTEEVKNTFTVGDVVITLTESPLNEDGSYGAPAEGTKNVYQMIPGTTYTKDPKVTVAKKSEKCYLFVEFAESGSPSSYLDYVSTLTTGNGWTQGDGKAIPNNVWWRIVEDYDVDQSWDLLQGDQITVNAEKVTKENMTAAAAASLTYKAYAVQFDNIADAATAWAKVQG